MTTDQLRSEIKALLKRAPRPDAIASIETARRFKEVAKKAASASSSARSTLAVLTDLRNQLAGYYP